MQRKGLNETGRRRITGPGDKVLSRGNAEIGSLNEMSTGLVMSRIENEEMGLVLGFHRSMVVVIWESGSPSVASM